MTTGGATGRNFVVGKRRTEMMTHKFLVFALRLLTDLFLSLVWLRRGGALIRLGLCRLAELLLLTLLHLLLLLHALLLFELLAHQLELRYAFAVFQRNLQTFLQSLDAEKEEDLPGLFFRPEPLPDFGESFVEEDADASEDLLLGDVDGFRVTLS